MAARSLEEYLGRHAEQGDDVQILIFDQFEELLTVDPANQRAKADYLTEVQHDLFDLGGELSIPGYNAVREVQVLRLEEAIGQFNAGLAPLKEFILPGGTRAAGLAHVARTICRRAERALVHLGASETVSEPVRKYVNRLSDLLFVLARVLNRDAGRADVLWRNDRKRGA